MLAKFRKPFPALGSAVYLFFFLASPLFAGMVGSFPSPDFPSAGSRSDEIQKIKTALENQLVRAKLSAYGLTVEEIEQKLDGMTDAQIHLMAQTAESVPAGGSDAFGVLIGALLIILLVVLILKAMGKSIVVH